jgi:hypothetical protein
VDALITEHDLQEAIAECQGVRNPDAKTCMMLAAFYTIKDKLYPDAKEEPVVFPQYSYDSPPIEVEEVINYQSDTDFGSAIHGKNTGEVLAIVDEAMDALSVLNPPLYKSIMRRIEY